MVNVKTNKYERYQSPLVKLNQSGITAKQGHAVITTSIPSSISAAVGMPQSSTSASRLMQTQAQASTSLKISSKGSKQMSQFRYGPVRAV